MTVKKSTIMMTLVFLIGLLASGTTYYLTKNSILYAVAITFGTTFYHFAMRLAIGYVIDAKYHNHMDDTKKWFQERSFEPQLYKWIRVKKWKKYLPSFRPGDFRFRQHSAEAVIQATCQAEIVHEVIMVLSFVPVVFSVWFGAASVFWITSWLAFLFDGAFVILQRYNRPRLRRLIKKSCHINAISE